ncbi:hypothetical protein TSUD_83690 [Trifolium subterraneum]|uniref:Uncharacterized protein n=1 Tax=Trifolium subterraneum TaxID=3900 RepID=A0A2Z6LWP7_TRISU|nr:hypothetical protein TSUD_83690 [Trifolium subterraneum]
MPNPNPRETASTVTVPLPPSPTTPPATALAGASMHRLPKDSEDSHRWRGHELNSFAKHKLFIEWAFGQD